MTYLKNCEIPLKVYKRHLTLFSISVQCVQSFRCYSGMDNDYQEVLCQECINGVGCLCAKIPDFMGHEYRFCRVNPHNAISPGCFQNDYYQGLTVDHCYCDTELCNASHSIGKASYLGFLLPPLLLTMYFNWNILYAQCLKITEKVSFNIASEASYEWTKVD